MKRLLIIPAVVVFYFLITEVTGTLGVFYPGTNWLLTALFALTLLSANQPKFSLLCYFLFILSFLFYRTPVEDNLNFKFYLWEWLKLVPRNKIVFLNVFGNILLFAPLPFFIRGRYSLLLIFFLVLTLEAMQYITKRGVFDIVDIFLNGVGISLGFILRRSYEKQR
ncbi:MAG TPA: VanZ family protein [Acholeplasmataceae bacterium]|nr:VanZ family protein [Acholeplasmataceae bacterium]